MTITEAWALVLDYYHDLLPAELQWRPGQKCDPYSCDLGHSHRSQVERQWRLIRHDIPPPALTDAAAMAVLRAIVDTDQEICCDVILYHGWYEVTFRDLRPLYVREVEPLRMPFMRDPELKVAAILAAVELAQKERAKENRGK